MDAACPTAVRPAPRRDRAAIAPAAAASAVAHAELGAQVDLPGGRLLCAGEIEVIATPRDVAVIRCAAGAVWVTQAGLHDDVVLESSQSFRPRPHGKIVIQALVDSAVTIEAAGDRPSAS